APIKGSLAQFLYINWRPTDREQEDSKLLEGCRPPIKSTESRDTLRSAETAIHLDFKENIQSYAFSLHGSRVLSAGQDKSVCLWDVQTGDCLRTFKGHTEAV